MRLIKKNDLIFHSSKKIKRLTKKAVMTEITLENVYDYVTYEYDLNKNILLIRWDKNNEDVENIMRFEGYHSYSIKRGFCWVELLKTITEWKDGEKINIISIFPTKGRLYVKWMYTQQKISAYNIVIGEDGYLYMRGCSLKKDPFIKVNCIFNDNLEI